MEPATIRGRQNGNPGLRLHDSQLDGVKNCETSTYRPTGYDLIAPGPVEVDAGKTASRDRQLQKT